MIIRVDAIGCAESTGARALRQSTIAGLRYCCAYPVIRGMILIVAVVNLRLPIREVWWKG
jgi:hypothetical protein